MRISELEEQQSSLQQTINELLITEQSDDYSSIEEITPYLPDSFDQAVVYNELILIRDMSGLESSSNYNTTFYLNADNPFDENISSSLNYVRISISMNVQDFNDVFDYMDNLIEADRLFYIQDLNLNIISNNNALIELEIYTFYMD